MRGPASPHRRFKESAAPHLTLLISADFLPFHCSGCGKTYCLTHRSAEGHSCTDSSSSRVVIVCPLCQTGIEQIDGEDPNVTFTRHEQRDCKRIQASKKKKQSRVCPVHGCSKKLTSLNACKCSKCEQEFCLTHRYYEDHACQGAPKAAGWLGSFGASSSGSSQAAARPPQAAARPGRTAAASGFLASLASRTGTAPSRSKAPSSTASRSSTARGTSSSASARSRRTPQRDATAELRATAARRRQGGSSQGAPTQTVLSEASFTQPPANTVPGREVCPHCSARYHSVLELVAHVEQAHPAAAPQAAAPAPTLPERCPQCAARFADVAQLVAHVEAQHSSPAAANGTATPAAECALQ